jgi:hypothetical protein
MSTEPKAEQMLDWPDATTTPWTEVCELIGKASTHWLTTIQRDGRPHVVPVGAGWLDGALWFTTGQGTQKEANVRRDGRCTISCAAEGYEIVVEGTAGKVIDQGKIERLAEVVREGGWPATAIEGALDAPYSAPTTGPAPYTVYEITPTKAFAFGTNPETVKRITRYRFGAT